MHQVPQVDVLQSCCQLPGDSFRVQLANASLGDVRSEVAQRGVLLGEYVEAGGFESYVVGCDYVPVGAQVETVVEFAVEISQGRVRFREGLQDHFRVGGFVLDEEDFSEPSFADDLEDVEFLREVYLQKY